jgi:flagellar basal-body rod protein FlgG
MSDLAIAGEGFFVVQTAQGERYTRNGRFTVDRDGRLVTGNGEPVLGGGGPLEVPGGQFAVLRDGSVVAEGNVIGRLQVVRFVDPSKLEHKGNSLLAAARDQTAEPLPPESVEVVQGSLETSNVDPIDALVDMIAAQRAFEIEARVMQTGDDSLDKAVNSLPSTR